MKVNEASICNRSKVVKSDKNVSNSATARRHGVVSNSTDELK